MRLAEAGHGGEGDVGEDHEEAGAAQAQAAVLDDGVDEDVEEYPHSKGRPVRGKWLWS